MVDFGGEVENNFKPIPAGDYKAKVISVTKKTSKAGNDYINIEFKLIPNDRHMWEKLMWHTDACVNITKSKLENLGFTRDERKALTVESMYSVVAAMVSGKVYDLKVGLNQETKENTIKYFSPEKDVSNADGAVVHNNEQKAPW